MKQFNITLIATIILLTAFEQPILATERKEENSVSTTTLVIGTIGVLTLTGLGANYLFGKPKIEQKEKSQTSDTPTPPPSPPYFPSPLDPPPAPPTSGLDPSSEPSSALPVPTPAPAQEPAQQKVEQVSTAGTIDINVWRLALNPNEQLVINVNFEPFERQATGWDLLEQNLQSARSPNEFAFAAAAIVYHLAEGTVGVGGRAPQLLAAARDSFSRLVSNANRYDSLLMRYVARVVSLDLEPPRTRATSTNRSSSNSKSTAERLREKLNKKKAQSADSTSSSTSSSDAIPALTEDNFAELTYLATLNEVERATRFGSDRDDQILLPFAQRFSTVAAFRSLWETAINAHNAVRAQGYHQLYARIGVTLAEQFPIWTNGNYMFVIESLNDLYARSSM